VTVVLVDAWHLSGSSAYRGIGTYLRNLLASLAASDDVDVRALTTNAAALPAGVEPVMISRRAPGRFATREHELRLPLDLRRCRYDVFHSPAQDPPRRCSSPWVQTLHDTTALIIDDPGLAGERKRLARLAPRFREAAAVIADSHDAARNGIELLGLDAARVHVIHLGVDSSYQPPLVREPHEPYVLYVGEFGPHKGFDEAFAVIAGLADLGYPHYLQIVGRIAPWYEEQIAERLGRSKRPDRVRLLGHVDDLVARYQQAEALIVTSRQEGFGLPAVEAMACGTPVVSFANSALVEVVGTGGTLVPDGDISAMIAAVRPWLDDPAARAVASRSALVRAAEFDWATTATAHAGVFRAVAG